MTAKNTVFWALKLYSPKKVWRFGGTYRLRLQSREINLNKEPKESGYKLSPNYTELQQRTSFQNLQHIFDRRVDFQRTTLHYIPEGQILHNRRCENLKS
jgi:ABC-type transport system involved in Fe-S cluster assembly fused permease/ATPase subunit